MENVKKNWLISFWIMTISLWIIGIFQYFFPDPRQLASIGDMFLLPFVVLGLATSSFFSWFTYHCAYRKEGTICLMILIILYPVGWLLQLVQYLNLSHPILFIDLVSFGLSVYFWINCLKLRSLNKVKSLESDLALNHLYKEKIDQAIQVLSDCCDKTSLQEAFRREMQSLPAKYTQILYKAYQERLAILN